MSENMKQKGWLIVAALFGLCLGGWLGGTCNHFREATKKVCNHFREATKMMTADTVIVRDTVRTVPTMAADSVVTGTIRMPLVSGWHIEPVMPNGHTTDSTSDSTADVQNTDKTSVADTVWATVPRMQKRYEDSLYTAWVSGYEPRLDSINVYRQTVTVTRTQTVTKHNRFNVGLTGGFGYGIFTRKPDVWVGIGVTWRPLP